MAIEGHFKLPVEKPQRPEDPSIPFVNYTEEEIEQAINDRGITREEFYREWHEQNAKLVSNS